MTAQDTDPGLQSLIGQKKDCLLQRTELLASISELDQAIFRLQQQIETWKRKEQAETLSCEDLKQRCGAVMDETLEWELQVWTQVEAHIQRQRGGNSQEGSEFRPATSEVGYEKSACFNN